MDGYVPTFHAIGAFLDDEDLKSMSVIFIFTIRKY